MRGAGLGNASRDRRVASERKALRRAECECALANQLSWRVRFDDNNFQYVPILLTQELGDTIPGTGSLVNSTMKSRSHQPRVGIQDLVTLACS